MSEDVFYQHSNFCQKKKAISVEMLLTTVA